MITSPTAYWQIVLASLTRLGKVPVARARDLLTQYRLRLSTMPAGLNQDMVYHNEPWQLALQLSGMGDDELRKRRLSTEEHQWYGKTVEKAVADAAAIGSEMELASSIAATAAALGDSMMMTGLAPFATSGYFASVAGSVSGASTRKKHSVKMTKAALGTSSK